MYLFKSLSKLVVVAALSVVTVVYAQGTKVGLVNSQRIMRESNPAKLAENKIEAEFSKTRKDLVDLSNRIKALADKLDKDAPVIAETERIKRQRELGDLDQDFQRKQRAFSEDLNLRRNEELANVIDKANAAIKQVAESEKYDVIFQDAAYFNPSIDITEKVLKILNK